jgi:hypothetical protein
MKYILELLGDQMPCTSKDAAINQLDSYLYHRPGQPIAAIYLNSKGKRRVLLAVGHDYGVGREGQLVRYTIIGDADASQSIVNYNWASQIKLSRIPYGRLLEDYAEHVNADGSRRFGYLGTDHDSWHSDPNDPDAIPNGATVQAAFEHILLGDFGSGSESDYIDVSVMVSPSQVTVPAEGEDPAQYTVTISVDFPSNGSLVSASYYTDGQPTSISNYLSQLSTNKVFSRVYTVSSDYSFAGNSKTITYGASATTAAGSTGSDTGQVTIIKNSSEPDDPGTDYKYKIYYHIVPDSGEDPVSGSSDFAIGAFPTLRQTSPFDYVPPGKHFIGWTVNDNGIGQKVTSLNQNMFTRSENEQAYILNLYTLWEEDSSGPQKLYLTADKQTVEYNGTDQTYDYSTYIQVNGGNIAINWTNVNGNIIGSGQGFTISFTGNAIPHGIDVNEYSEAVSLTITDPVNYEMGGASDAQAVLKITKKSASVTPKINGSQSVSLEVGSDMPTITRILSGFTETDNTTMSNISGWESWSPELDLNITGTYKLSFNSSLVPSAITNNYTIEYYTASLTITDLDLIIRYKTYSNNETSLDTAPAQHITNASDHVNIQYNGVDDKPSNVTGVVDWWIIFANNKSATVSTTEILSNKNVKITEVKVWSSAAQTWYKPSGVSQSSLVTPFDSLGTNFTYQIPGPGGTVIQEKAFVAIKVE